MGSSSPAAFASEGVVVLVEVEVPVPRVAVPVREVAALDPVAVVLVPLGVPVETVLLPPMALLMMLPMMPLAADDGIGTGRGMATRVVLVFGAAGGGDVLSPTGMPEGPVGTKLAGVVAASG